jgi:NodT family efflux transporter outer membrane factor (OMF) lipoprotein
MKTPAQFTGLPGTPITPAPATDLSQWWKQIDDPTLQRLVQQALSANLDLQTAASRVRQAREREVIASAGELPQVSASGAAAKLHSDSNPLAGLSGGAGGMDLNVFSVGLDASWEADIFGGGRRAIEAARANTEAAVWQMRDGEVSLTAEIANDYLELRAAQARLAVLNAELASEQDTLRLINGRAQAGFLTELDVNQQRAAVASTAAQVPAVQSEIRILEHAIAVLLAEQPDALSAALDSAAALPKLPARLPVGLPSDLLRNRPDVRAAERALAAATAEEGGAIADLYPKFNLLGLLSLVGNSFSGLFTDPSASEIGLAQITWPLFTAGRTHANIRIKQEDEQQAYRAYQNAILKAVRDVEDALVRLAAAQRQAGDLKIAVDSARSSITIATQQYNVGMVPYLNVLSAQNQYNAAQDQFIQNQQAEAQALVAVFKALGGGWTDAAPAPARDRAR